MVVQRISVLLVLLFSVGVICQDEEDAGTVTDEHEEIPISEHEYPKENIPTRPDYKGKGHWATPAPDSGIDLGFVPIKLYTQVSSLTKKLRSLHSEDDKFTLIM